MDVLEGEHQRLLRASSPRPGRAPRRRGVSRIRCGSSASACGCALGRLDAEHPRRSRRRCARPARVVGVALPAVPAPRDALDAASPRRTRPARRGRSRTRPGSPRRTPSRRSRRRRAGTRRVRSAGAGSSSRRPLVSSRSSRDLPTPAWPITVTRCGRPSRPTRSARESSSRDSSSRPISGAAVRGAARCAGPSVSTSPASQAGTGSDFPFSVERLELVVGDRRRGWRGRCVSPTVTVPGPRGGLEPGGDVDRVADHRVAVAHPAGQHLAGVDPDPQQEAVLVAEQLRVEPLHRRLHRQPGADGALGVVLVGDRGAEDGHHVVADVLVDRAAEADRPPRRAGAACGRASTSPPRGPCARRRRCSRRGRRRGRRPGAAPRAGVSARRAAAGAGRRPAPARPPASTAVPHSMQNLAPAGTSAPQLGQRRSSACAAGHAEAGALRVLGAAAGAEHVPKRTASTC